MIIINENRAFWILLPIESMKALLFWVFYIINQSTRQILLRPVKFKSWFYYLGVQKKSVKPLWMHKNSAWPLWMKRNKSRKSIASLFERASVKIVLNKISECSAFCIGGEEDIIVKWLYPALLTVFIEGSWFFKKKMEIAGNLKKLYREKNNRLLYYELVNFRARSCSNEKVRCLLSFDCFVFSYSLCW